MAKTRIGVAILVTYLCLTVGFAWAAHLATDLMLPSIGRSGGLNNSMWYTTLWVHNPGSQTAVVQISLLLRDQANPSPNTVTITLAAGTTVTYKDLLYDLFGLETVSGALHVTSDGAVMASARIFNNPAGDLSESLGQFLAGVPTSLAIATGGATDVPGITHPADQSFRCNWGLVETAGGTAQVRVTLVDGDGVTMGQRTVLLGPYQPMQQSIGLLGGGTTVDGGCLHVEVLSGDGRVMAFASMIANGSGDPSTLEMEYRLPAAGSGDGDITSVTAGDGLSGGGQDGDVTLHVAPGDGLEIANEEVALADSGVTKSKLSATGGDVGQVLTTDGAALVWQDVDDASMQLPYEGAAAGADPAFKVSNSTAVALHGDGGTIGVRGVGGQMGGYFKPANGTSEAKVGREDRGVRATGAEMGASFHDMNGSGEARLAYGDQGVQGLGTDRGGRFWDSDGTGTVSLGIGNRGLNAAGTETGGYFADSDSSGFAYVGYGDYGIEAHGNEAGGFFQNPNGPSQAMIAVPGRGIQATANSFGGVFEATGSLSTAGVFTGADTGVSINAGDVGLIVKGVSSAATFEDSTNTGRAELAKGDRGIIAEGDTAAVSATGDLVVNDGAFHGNVGPNGGAPFPRPAYDSGWVEVDRRGSLILEPALPDDPDSWFIQVLSGGGGTPNHLSEVNREFPDGNETGEWWVFNKRTGQLTLDNYNSHDHFMRVKIWVIK